MSDDPASDQDAQRVFVGDVALHDQHALQRDCDGFPRVGLRRYRRRRWTNTFAEDERDRTRIDAHTQETRLHGTRTRRTIMLIEIVEVEEDKEGLAEEGPV